MQNIAARMQNLAKSSSIATTASSNTALSQTQSTRSSGLNFSVQRALSPQSLQSSNGSAMPVRLSSMIRASANQKEIPQVADPAASAVEGELRLDFSETDLRDFASAMRSNTIRLDQEINNMNKEQEQAIDGVGRLIENVAKAMNTAIARSEERITNDLMSKLEQFQKTSSAGMATGPGHADLVQAAKALSENDNKELYSMLSTCTSLLEAMQVRVSQLETAVLEISLRDRSESATQQKEDDSIWAEALRSTLKRTAGTPIRSGEVGRRTLGGTPKSPSNASQVSTQIGGFSQPSQSSAICFLPRSTSGDLNREQEQLKEDSKHTVVPIPQQPQAQDLPSASADEAPIGQTNLLSQIKSNGLRVPDEGGSLDLSHPRGRLAAAPLPAAGLCRQQQALGTGGLRSGISSLPSGSSGNAPVFPARNRSADNLHVPFRPSSRPEGPGSPCLGSQQRHLLGAHSRQNLLDQGSRAQSVHGAVIGACGSMSLQAGVRRTSASVMGQPLRPGM